MASAKHLLSHILVSYVSFLMTPDTFPTTPVSIKSPVSFSFLMSPVPCLMSPVSSFMSPVSHLMSPVPRLLSPISHLLSHVSCLSVFCLLSHVSCPYQTPLVSQHLPPVSHLLSHVYCLSHVSCLYHVSYFLTSQFFCLMSTVVIASHVFLMCPVSSLLSV